MSVTIEYLQVEPAAWVEVTDDDAATFLQSQFSNDLRAGPRQATYGLWLDHRGRIHGDSVILQLAETRFFLLSWATPSHALIDKLSAHIIADDVVLADQTTTIGSVVLQGPGADDWLSSRGFTLPAAAEFSATDGFFLVRPRPGLNDAWQLVGPRARMEEFVEALAEKEAQRLKPEAWHAARIAAKSPLIPNEVGPEDTPIEAGLEALCSWTKGCFLGQEVVARQHRLGRRSRSLSVIHIEGELPATPLPWDLLDGESVVGSMRAVARHGDVLRGLAMIKSRVSESPPAEGLRINGTQAKGYLDVSVG